MPDAFDFENKEFLVTCKHEEYNEQLRAKWSVYRPSTSKPLTRDRLLALNDRFGHLVPEVKKRHAVKEAEGTAKVAAKAAKADLKAKVPPKTGNNASKPVPPDVPF